MHFASGTNNLQDSLADFLCVTTDRFFDLGKAGRVNIQGFHINQDFIVPDSLEIVVQLFSGLWQDACRLNHPVTAKWISTLDYLYHGPPFNLLPVSAQGSTVFFCFTQIQQFDLRLDQILRSVC